MPFMKWVKTPDGYKPVEITDEEMFAENARRRGKRAEVWLDEANEMVKREKERTMEFDKSRVYTAVNADELRAGDKVIVADQLYVLKQRVQECKENSAVVLQKINGEDWGRRFGLTMSDFALAYLVERAENCTNCIHDGKQCVITDLDRDRVFRCPFWKLKDEPKEEVLNEENCTNCKHSCCHKDGEDISKRWCRYYEPRTEQKAEPHYRPFKDVDELVKVWCEYKCPAHNHRERGLTMPLIWVRHKKEDGSKSKGHLIHGFYEDIIEMQDRTMNMKDLFYFCEFLDGSLCGVEE